MITTSLIVSPSSSPLSGSLLVALAPKVPIKTRVQRYDLADANAALGDLRDGRLQGAAVLVP